MPSDSVGLQVGCEDFRKQKATGQRFSAINQHNNLRSKCRHPNTTSTSNTVNPKKAAYAITFHVRNSSAPSPHPTLKANPSGSWQDFSTPSKSQKQSYSGPMKPPTN